MIIKKTPQQIEMMAEAGRLHAECMKVLIQASRVGVTTAELDRKAESFITERGGTPSFLGYRGFPASICASPNSLVVHGFPDDSRLKQGDILSIDLGVTKDGWVADGAVTLPIGQVSPVALQLLGVSKRALFDAVDAAIVGNRVGDISWAVQQRIEGSGLSVIRNLVGHGVGREMHEDPQVPNFGSPGKGPRLEAGMVLAIEPMVNTGLPEVRTGSDGWAVFSADDSLAAHFEFTVAITEAGPRILTPWHE